MPTYGWLTQTAAVEALQARLNSTTFWSAAEAWLYLSEALRHWNGLTEQWNSDFPLSNNGSWINTGTAAGSPRLRTITDQYLYNQMCSMLLEPPLNTGVWAGTNQFTLANLQYNLQKRTNEVIQASACNLAQLTPLTATPGVRRYTLPDTVLEQRRTRFLSVVANTPGTASSGAVVVTVASAAGIYQGLLISGTGIQAGTFVTTVSGLSVGISLPTTGNLSGTALQFAQAVTLTREDTISFQSFQPGYTSDYGSPQSWSVASEPPLGFDTDNLPNTAGSFDIIALNSAPVFDPPATSLIGLPDDWSWVPMYGALADILGMESEATDRAKAAYCLQRYTQGLQMFKDSNWLLKTLINGAVSDPVALADMDGFANGWQNSTFVPPCLVQAGMDMIAPVPGLGQSVVLTLLGNAPLLDSTNTYVQVSRDDFEAILNYSQHLTSFKQPSGVFSATMPLLKDFYRAAAERNKRWINYGLFVDNLHEQGKKQEDAEPR
jgi:hypothetical protein